MLYFPKNTDFIDIHSHHLEVEENVFRIHNVFSSDYRQIPSGRPVSIGLHPWYLTSQSKNELTNILKQALNLQNVIAVGEAGLDMIIKTPVEEQLPVFRTQIELSKEYNKPLIIHCVKAFPDLFKLRKEYLNATPWIVHGFNANESIAGECVNLGIYLSLSQRLFRNSEKTRNIIKVVPLSMVLAETDDDTMHIQGIYQTISKLYRRSIDEVKIIIFENYSRIFGKN